MSKTLGQIAYEAAAEFWETDNEAAWEAAAQAVAHATVVSNAFHPITLAKEDVIEAARGWRDSDQAAAECAILLQTLAALDKAEAEDE